MFNLDCFYDIPDHPNYKVDTKGNILNVERNTLVVPFVQKGKYGGYLRVNLNGKTEYVHRIVAKTFMGDLRDLKFYVTFKDGDRQNCCLENLQIVLRPD